MPTKAAKIAKNDRNKGYLKIVGKNILKRKNKLPHLHILKTVKNMNKKIIRPFDGGGSGNARGSFTGARTPDQRVFYFQKIMVSDGKITNYKGEQIRCLNISIPGTGESMRICYINAMLEVLRMALIQSDYDMPEDIGCYIDLLQALLPTDDEYEILMKAKIKL